MVREQGAWLGWWEAHADPVAGREAVPCPHLGRVKVSVRRGQGASLPLEEHLSSVGEGSESLRG